MVLKVWVIQREKIFSALLEVFISDNALRTQHSNLIVLAVAFTITHETCLEKKLVITSPSPSQMFCVCKFFFFFLTFGLGWMRLTTHHLVSKYFYRREFKYHRIRATAQVIWVFFSDRLFLIEYDHSWARRISARRFRWELTMLTN